MVARGDAVRGDTPAGIKPGARAYFAVCLTLREPTEENRRTVLAYLDWEESWRSRWT